MLDVMVLISLLQHSAPNQSTGSLEAMRTRYTLNQECVKDWRFLAKHLLNDLTKYRCVFRHVKLLDFDQ